MHNSQSNGESCDSDRLKSTARYFDKIENIDSDDLQVFTPPFKEPVSHNEVLKKRNHSKSFEGGGMDFIV